MEELFKTMAEKLYDSNLCQSDYENDKSMIENYPTDEFIWMVRPQGTNLILLGDWLDEVLWTAVRQGNWSVLEWNIDWFISGIGKGGIYYHYDGERLKLKTFAQVMQIYTNKSASKRFETEFTTKLEGGQVCNPTRYDALLVAATEASRK